MRQDKLKRYEEIAKIVRRYVVISTTTAGSGHPTSCLSSTDLMTLLFFKHLRYDLKNPKYCNNDRVIFSKGHAAPLLYSLFTVAGIVKEEELMTIRRFSSPLEGHPSPRFRYIDVATGSLGQGLSIGIGMALNAKYIDKLPYKNYVLLGDSELAEGSVWEAAETASFYKLDNLVAIVDVNRLGQRGETMLGWNTSVYEKRFKAFGWNTITINGHDLNQIDSAFKKASSSSKPFVIIARTVKGKGVKFLENKNGWHGKPVPKERLNEALKSIGPVNKRVKGTIKKPLKRDAAKPKLTRKDIKIDYSKPLATRKVYGKALAKILPRFNKIVVLDAEVSNSTYSKDFEKIYPERFFEMFIAEQNMIGVAVGFSAIGKVPFVSTFAAFLTRAFDQIRMAQYSNANIKFVGSHAGVSIGADGPSQMGLEDIAMFRSILNSVVLYPSDAVSAEKLIEEAAKHKGIIYLRMQRSDTPIIYKEKENFRIGGSKILKHSKKDKVTIVSAGITLIEALKAYDYLKNKGINVRIIDLYSIKPIDKRTLLKAAKETKAIITVEDHYPAGGLGDAVRAALSHKNIPVYSLTVKKIPRSGAKDELLRYECISSEGIVRKVKEVLRRKR